MANKFKNERDFPIAGRTILLRPTFENLANLESKLGSVAYLCWKFSKFKEDFKNLPGVSEITFIVFYCQAANDRDYGQKPMTLEETFDLVCQDTVPNMLDKLLDFLAGVTLGNKQAPDPADMSEALKKN